MTEQVGKIHGLISRENAWEMWAPYGERVIPELDGSLDPDNITPDEAVRITYYATDTLAGEIYEHVAGSLGDNDEWWFDVGTAVAQGPKSGLVKALVKTHRKQQRLAEEMRVSAINEGEEFVELVAGAAQKLVKAKILTAAQAELAESWLVGPDGKPYMQHTPMSQLEYLRYMQNYDHEAPDLYGGYATVFMHGVITSTPSLRPDSKQVYIHNRVHETVHGSLAGTEIWDVTRDDGIRFSDATVVGHFASEPTTAVIAGDDYSICENTEVNEGFTDFLTWKLMGAEPKLGKPLKDTSDGYGAWADQIQKIRKSDRALYGCIAEASFIEAGRDSPNDKRRALTAMHEYADSKLGVANALTKLFTDAGGSLLEIHTKGKAASK
jgi:hypothetical protein